MKIRIVNIQIFRLINRKLKMNNNNKFIKVFGISASSIRLKFGL